MKKEMENAKKTIQSFKNSFSSIMGGLKTALVGLAIGKTIKDSVQSAMEIESALNQIKRIMGESSNQFLKWANDTAIAFGMSKGEAVKYGAVYGNLLSSFTKSTGETMQYTEELLKSAAIVASGTGRTMQDVLDRIRSGILGNTESIEDLSINVNVAMLESTEAFKKFANNKSWNQLSFQTQQQIRVMAILEQASKKYGDSLNQNTASAQAQFVAQLKNLQLSLGQAFLPIYNAILPALTALAASLANFMGVIAQFSQALFGSAASKQAAQVKTTAQQASAVSGLGDAYKKAGKEAKGALVGFDEINSLADKSGGSDDASSLDGAAAMPVGNMPMNFDTNAPEVSAKIQDMANKVKAVFADMASVISENKDVVVSALAGILAGFASFQIISNWSAIVLVLDKAFKALSVTMSGISMPILAMSALIALLVGNIVYLWRTNEEFRNSVIEVWTQIKTFVTTIVNDMWSIVKEIWDKYGQTLIENIAGFMKSIQNIIQAAWESFIKPIVTNALNMLSTLWTEHLSGLASMIGEFIMKLINFALEIWNGFIAPVVGYLIETFGPVFADVFNSVINTISMLIGIAADVAKGLFKSLGGILDFLSGTFSGNWAKAWNGVKDIFKGVFDSLYAIVKVPLNAIIDAINDVISGLNKIHFDLPDWLPGNLGGKSFGITIGKIPKLAKGGITNGEMTAVVGDNPGGKEVISPLDDLMDMIGTSVGNAMMAANQFNSNNNQDINLNLNIDGTTFARATYSYNQRESSRVGNAMIITT
jgi:phage-related protein